MKSPTLSLSLRLFLAAAAFIAIVFTGVIGITYVILDRFVHRQIDQQLDAQVAAISAALVFGSDGRVALSPSFGSEGFNRLLGGWYWEVEGKNILRSPSLGADELKVPKLPDNPPPSLSGDSRTLNIVAADGPGPANDGLHFRVGHRSSGGQRVTIATTAPNDAFIAPLHQAMAGVFLALGLSAVALFFAMYLQVRLGLLPLRRLRDAVAGVRAGLTPRLPTEQPSEVAPLVEELNKLIGENAEGLARARRHVSNLAHGLKTPLANLAIAVRENDSDGDLSALIDQMDQRIRHHLLRAKTAAIEGRFRARTPLRERIVDLVEAMAKIYAGRNIEAVIDVDHSLAVACESQDTDELLGNIIDNAFRWARARVNLRATREGKSIVLTIEDDGMGLRSAAGPQFLADNSADEHGPSYGLGIAISRELIELYGGSLEISPGQKFGLSVTVVLPAGI